MKYKIKKFQNPSSTLQYFGNLNQQAQDKNNSAQARIDKAFKVAPKEEKHVLKTGGTEGYLKHYSDPSKASLIDKLKNTPGLTIDDSERGYHALNRDHWALRPEELTGSTQDKAFIYGMAALNRVLPTLKKLKLDTPVKKVAEKVMSERSGPGRSWQSLFTKDNKYTGWYTGNSGESNRNLIKMYLYGDETGFKEAPKDLEGITLGKRYDELYPDTKRYMLDSHTAHGDTVDFSDHSDYYTPPNQLSKTRKYNVLNKTFGLDSDSPVGPKDDVAGHVGKVISNNGEQTLVSQDIWKFNPKDYANKWSGGNSLHSVRQAGTNRLTQQKQSAILDKLGTPFILTQHNPIKR